MWIIFLILLIIIILTVCFFVLGKKLHNNVATVIDSIPLVKINPNGKQVSIGSIKRKTVKNRYSSKSSAHSVSTPECNNSVILGCYNGSPSRGSYTSTQYEWWCKNTAGVESSMCYYLKKSSSSSSSFPAARCNNNVLGACSVGYWSRSDDNDDYYQWWCENEGVESERCYSPVHSSSSSSTGSGSYGTYSYYYYSNYVSNSTNNTTNNDQSSVSSSVSSSSSNRSSSSSSSFSITTTSNYKWVNNGLVSESDGRKTGTCGKTSVKTYTCSSSTLGDKLYDGTNRGFSYNDVGHAWPIYDGEETSVATEYTYNGCGLDKRTGGTVNEWTCQFSGSVSHSSSSSSRSSSASSSSLSSTSSSSSSFASLTAITGSALDTTSTSANLNGTINPQGQNVSIYFNYRKESESSDATKTTGWVSTFSKSNDTTTTVTVSALSPGTKYVYRFYAYSYDTGKTVSGELKSFTTLAGSSSSSCVIGIKYYTLNIRTTGFGSVKIPGENFNCNDSRCSVSYEANKEVTLKAVPSTNKVFFGFSGDLCSYVSDNQCVIKINSNKTVSADFTTGRDDDDEQPLLVRLSGDGNGSISDNNGEISCGLDCIGKYHTQTITLTARPSSNSVFSNWSGACGGSDKVCNVAMDGNSASSKKVTAVFSLKNSSSSSSQCGQSL